MSENHYQVLFEISQHALFMTTPAGHLTEVNPAWLNQFSYTKEEAAELNLSAMFVRAKERKNFWQEVKQQGSVKDFEARLYTKDGRQTNCFITLTTRRADDGSVTGYRGIIHNSTDGHQTEQVLKAYNLALEKQVVERTQQLEMRIKQLETLNFITQMVASAHDTQSALEIVAREMAHLLNARNCGLTLLNEEQTALTVVADYSFNADEPSRTGTVIPLAGNSSSRQVIETGQSIVISDPQRSQLTEAVHDILRMYHTECLMILPLLARGKVIGTIGVDTDQPDRVFTSDEVMLAEMVAIQIAGIIQNVRLFDQDLEQAYQQLKDLDRLKSSFIGVITHELRSPFVAADLSVQLLYRYAERGMIDEMFDQLKRLDQELLEGQQMINSLISFASLMSKQGELFLEATDLPALIRDTVAPLEKILPARQIQLFFRFSPDLPQVYLDQQRMSEAIYHLVHNAIKFNNEGGTVEISCWVKAGKVFFKVSDTGRGIPAKDLASIWQAFAQTAHDVQRGLEGLGLGLALVKAAVDAHGGEVSATSKLNEGSAFGFWIPVKPRPKKKVNPNRSTS